MFRKTGETGRKGTGMLIGMRGTVWKKDEEEKAVNFEVQGLIHSVMVTRALFERLALKAAADIVVVRQFSAQNMTDERLFGFNDFAELEMFKDLISVNRVGGTTAINLLWLPKEKLVEAVVWQKPEIIVQAGVKRLGVDLIKNIILDLHNKWTRIYGRA